MFNAKPPKERESKIQRSIIVRLRHRFGIRLWRRNVGRAKLTGGHHVQFASPGQADLWGVHHGIHIEIETKRPGNKPTPKQIEWLKEMTSLSAIAFWGDNANDVERVMEAILQGGKVIWDDGCEYHVEMP